jgi:hypothetical protein
MNYATKFTILRWLQIGKREGATHMLLIEDSLAEEHVPVYVAANEKLDFKIKRFDDAHSMRIRAVFDLAVDLAQQVDTFYR